MFFIKGTCSYHVSTDHTSSAYIWNGKKHDLFCIPENWVVSTSGFHVMKYDVQTILKIKCIGNSVWNLICFSRCIERGDSRVDIAAVFKGFDFILCVSICFFSTILKMQKYVSCGSNLNFIYFCGVFVFLTGTSSGWSCSFDGTPVNDVYTTWSEANKSFCTCFWNSGEWCS